MTSRKSASLNRQINRASSTARRRVTIEGRCGFGGREPKDVLVTDLGETGCRLQVNAVGVSKAEPLALWLGETGPIAGRLEWTRGGSLGVSFESPLTADALEALYETSRLATVVPLRR